MPAPFKVGTAAIVRQHHVRQAEHWRLFHVDRDATAGVDDVHGDLAPVSPAVLGGHLDAVQLEATTANAAALAVNAAPVLLPVDQVIDRRCRQCLAAFGLVGVCVIGSTTQAQDQELLFGFRLGANQVAFLRHIIRLPDGDGRRQVAPAVVGGLPVDNVLGLEYAQVWRQRRIVTALDQQPIAAHADDLAQLLHCHGVQPLIVGASVIL